MRPGHWQVGACGGAGFRVRQSEHRHRLHQLLRLRLQAVGSCRALFDQRRVLLRGLVHFGDGVPHLGHACTLLAAGGADLAHDVRHTADGADHLAHRGARLVYQRGAQLYALHAGVDQGLDLLGGVCAALGQVAHLAGNHRKAPALLARAGCFHGGVQREDVGLEGDAVDHADDVGNLLAAVVDALHGRHHLGHHITALHGHGAGAHGQLVGGARVFGIGLHGGAQLLHRRRGFFQRAGLLLGAGAQVVVALCDFGTGGGHAVGVVAHIAHHVRQADLHVVQGIQQQGDFVLALHLPCHGEVAAGHGLRHAHRVVQRVHYGAAEGNGARNAQGAHHQHHHQADGGGALRSFGGALGHFAAGLGDQATGLVQQLRGLAVHARHGLVARLRVVVCGLEGLKPLAVGRAHALVGL
ncbi:hypothetical protein D3C71_1004500 [compost metagenome]